MTTVDEPADYRFLLANERTFLAYVRTALALQVAGLGALQFLTQGHGAVRIGLGLALVVSGSALGLTGYLRFSANDRAIRAGGEMRTARATSLVTVAVSVVPLVAAAVIALS